jgi:hypothetical protein
VVDAGKTSLLANLAVQIASRPGERVWRWNASARTEQRSGFAALGLRQQQSALDMRQRSPKVAAVL